MWSRATLMDLDASSSGGVNYGRVIWADLAKALSIILLVFYTIIGDQVYLNETLILVRMPLFFFVSGLFAHHAILRSDWRGFLRDKIGNLIWLYVLWIGILFLSRDMVAHLAWGRPADPLRQLTIFWDPIFTIWFLYALAIAFVIARLLRNLPVWLVFIGAFAVYAAFVSTGEWRWLSFADRLARLFPFFWLGLVLRPLADRAVERLRGAWAAAVALFLTLAWAVFSPPLNAVPPVTFAVSLLGILAMLLLARRLAETPLAPALGVLGASTLIVYVMHRPALFYMEHGLGALGLDHPPLWAEAMLAPPAILACVILGRRLQGWRPTAWLFAAPWTLPQGSAHRRAEKTDLVKPGS